MGRAISEPVDIQQAGVVTAREQRESRLDIAQEAGSGVHSWRAKRDAFIGIVLEELA